MESFKSHNQEIKYNLHRMVIVGQDSTRVAKNFCFSIYPYHFAYPQALYLWFIYAAFSFDFPNSVFFLCTNFHSHFSTNSIFFYFLVPIHILVLPAWRWAGFQDPTVVSKESKPGEDFSWSYYSRRRAQGVPSPEAMCLGTRDTLDGNYLLATHNCVIVV